MLESNVLARAPEAPRPLSAPVLTAPLPNGIKVSFEFFPPKSEKEEQSLWACVRRLAPVRPTFVSVTYGAGGSTRDRTYATALRLKHEAGLEPAAHLTCIDATRGEIDAIARRYWQNGIRHIVAVRGDPPAGHGHYRPRIGGYTYAADLVAGLKKIADFEISVAAYPETHPEAPSADDDLDNLKRKIDAGATRAITQFFFDVDVYFRFVERAQAAGITAPIVPGILPAANFARAAEFAAKCGATVPAWIADLLEGLDDDPDTRRLIATTIAVEQCRLLAAGGVREFHFYTLNRADVIYAVCRILDVRPSGNSESAAKEKPLS